MCENKSSTCSRHFHVSHDWLSFKVFVLVPDVQLSNTKRPGRDASFTKGGDISRDVLGVRSSVLLDNHTACPGVPFAVVTGGHSSF